MKKFNKKFYIITSILIVFTIIASCGIVYAIQFSNNKATNIITSNSLSLKLYDEIAPGIPFPEEGISNIMPGDIVNKYVYVENDDKADEWVRIHLDYDFTSSPTSGRSILIKDISLNINTKKWIYKDGWYYYKDILKSGDFTEYLFTNVEFSYLLDNDYEDCKVKINVYARSTQSDNNGSSVLEAKGWPKLEKRGSKK